MDKLRWIESLEAKVAVLETRPDARRSILAALRQNGYTRFAPCKSFEELKSYLRNGNSADWAVVSFTEENYHLVASEIENWHLEYSPHFSLLYNHNVGKIVPTLFEYGVISATKTDYSTTQLANEFRSLIKAVVKCKYDQKYLAASSLRQVLKSISSHKELLHLERCLSQDFTDQRVNTLETAEALFLCKSYLEAFQMLDRAAYFSPKASERVGRMEKQFSEIYPTENLQFAERLGIKSVAIIQQETEIRQILEKICIKIGIETVESFPNADEFWRQGDKKKNLDFIISDWIFNEGISGSQLLQRIRSGHCKNSCIMLYTDPLPKEVGPLLNQMQISKVIYKPASVKKILMAIAWTIHQWVRPTEPKTLERKILQKLVQNEFTEAFLLRKKLETTDGVPPARQKYVDAMFSFVAKDYNSAILTLDEAILESDSPGVDLSILKGQALYRKGEIVNGVKEFEAAQNVTTDSVGLLCWLAEANIELGNFDKSLSYIKKSESIDSKNEWVILAKAKYNLFLDNSDELEKIKPQAQIWEDLFHYVNNLGVQAAHKNDLKQAIRTYQRGLAYLTNDDPPVFAFLNYNLSLALIRSKETTKAKIYLNRAIDYGNSSIYQKAVRTLNSLNNVKDFYFEDPKASRKSTGCQSQGIGQVEKQAETNMALRSIYVVNASQHRIEKLITPAETQDAS